MAHWFSCRTQFVVTMDRVDERYTVGDEGEQEEEGGEEVKERGRLQKSHGGGEGIYDTHLPCDCAV